MKELLKIALLIVTFGLLAGCGDQKSSLLEETSGVWRAQGDGAMISVIYNDSKLRLLINDDLIPVTLGDIDEVNKTINMNVALNTGKPGIWTLRQVWDKDNNSFHLQLTLHDGTQDSLSFVRKLSSDDLNKLANMEAANQTASLSAAAAATGQASQNQPIDPAVTDEAPADLEVQSNAEREFKFGPSFDCAKAGNFAENAICNDPVLGELDGALSQNYKNMLGADIGDGATEDLRSTQKEWIKKRNSCADHACLINTYRARLDEICDYPVITGMHPTCLYAEELN